VTPERCGSKSSLGDDTKLSDDSPMPKESPPHVVVAMTASRTWAICGRSTTATTRTFQSILAIYDRTFSGVIVPLSYYDVP
jgi:hypothetical protein